MIDWKNVKYGAPLCDGETVFVGVNSIGYCGCFNECWVENPQSDLTYSCYYATAEGHVSVMSGLEWWALLETPDATPNSDDYTPPHWEMHE